MPRRYTLGKRADLAAATRDRIVAAAADIIRARGAAAATTLAVAQAADVAPATVRNHFMSRDDLTAAVLDLVWAEVRPPGAEIFAGLDDIGARVRRLAEELAAFFERSESWWRIYQREPALTEAWSSANERWEHLFDELARTALGPLARDATARAVMTTVIGTPGLTGFRARGLGWGESAELGVELALPWLEARASAAATATRSSSAAATATRSSSAAASRPRSGGGR